MDFVPHLVAHGKVRDRPNHDYRLQAKKTVGNKLNVKEEQKVCKEGMRGQLKALRREKKRGVQGEQDLKLYRLPALARIYRCRLQSLSSHCFG